jgi:hypothetical protein
MSVAIRSGLKKEDCPFGDLHSGWFLFPGEETNPSRDCLVSRRAAEPGVNVGGRERSNSCVKM